MFNSPSALKPVSAEIGVGTLAMSVVSIVTPAYNEENYLRECIESVLSQTYQDWNYTIVDNCSDDGTHEIAASYAKRDARIQVIRNDRTVSAIDNHNIAFRAISKDCKYCKLIA